MILQINVLNETFETAANIVLIPFEFKQLFFSFMMNIVAKCGICVVAKKTIKLSGNKIFTTQAATVYFSIFFYFKGLKNWDSYVILLLILMCLLCNISMLYCLAKMFVEIYLQLWTNLLRHPINLRFFALINEFT